MPSITKYLASLRADARTTIELILREIYNGHRSDTDLAAALRLPNSTIAAHLRRLENDRITTVQRVRLHNGYRNVTQLGRHAARWVRTWLDSLRTPLQISQKRAAEQARKTARILKAATDKASRQARQAIERTKQFTKSEAVKSSLSDSKAKGTNSRSAANNTTQHRSPGIGSGYLAAALVILGSQKPACREVVHSPPSARPLDINDLMSTS